MRYIVTGKYINGDEYAEAFEDIEQLADNLRYIAGHNHDGAPDHYRVLVNTIKIETEE